MARNSTERQDLGLSEGIRHWDDTRTLKAGPTSESMQESDITFIIGAERNRSHYERTHLLACHFWEPQKTKTKSISRTRGFTH